MFAFVRTGCLHELVRSELPQELLEGLGLAVVNHGKHRISAQAEGSGTCLNAFEFQICGGMAVSLCSCWLSSYSLVAARWLDYA